jgi:glutamyl-tRNA reductase
MSPEKPARIFALGVNHRSGSAFLRDRLFLDEARTEDFYRRLATGSIRQAVVLSTCDRVEVQGADPDPARAVETIRDLLAAAGGLEADALKEELYIKTDEAAVRHVFAVAASLDSQIIGEPQVLGQVKTGHRAARSAGLMGPELDDLLQAAYATAKRVRTETTIGARGVSIASVATQVARDLHGRLEDVSVLAVGLGEIGDLIVQQLRAGGVSRVELTGPERRVETEARHSGAHFLAYDELDAGLARADVVVSAAGFGRYVIDSDKVRNALRRRRQRPILFIDGGIPLDVEPDVHGLDGAFVYTLDDLERVAMEGRREREAVSMEAWRIVDEAAEIWRVARTAREAAPTVVALRRRFENIREEVLAANGEADAGEATRLLINRLLHDPSIAISALAAGKDGASLETERLVRHLFALEGDEESEEEDK